MNGFLLALLLSVCVTPIVGALARRLGWVAQPQADRWHSRPTALMGGIAIFTATSAGWLLTLPLASVRNLWATASLMFLIGCVDDRRALRPYIKLVAQIIACALFMIEGERLGSLPYFISGPVTLLWLVAITNAINLLDNMDGLAAGVTAISALTLSVNASLQGDAVSAAAALCLAGSCVGFLVFNYRPARIFMGDCGSLFLGFSLAALGVQSVPRSAPNLLVSLVVPVLLLAIPIFDTALVTIARMLHGRKISQGGRDHSSHRLFALGLSESASVLFLYTLTAASGLVAIAVSGYPPAVGLPIAGLFAILLVALGLFIGFIRVYPHAPEDRPILGGLQIARVWQFLPQFAQVLIDTLLIPLAFGGAHLLRFEGDIPREMKPAILAAFPVVWVSKLAGMALVRAYRGEWRYAGLMDGVNGLLGASLGSVFAILLLVGFQGLKGISRAALALDWLLFSLLVAGARTWFPALSQVFGLLAPRSGRRVLLLGIGLETPGRVQMLRNPFAPYRSQILGHVDDDPRKQGRTLNGVPVIGTIADLPELLSRHPGALSVLGVSVHTARGEALLQRCRDLGVEVHPDVESLCADRAHPIDSEQER